jgi:hypothetical protein
MKGINIVRRKLCLKCNKFMLSSNYKRHERICNAIKEKNDDPKPHVELIKKNIIKMKDIKIVRRKQCLKCNKFMLSSNYKRHERICNRIKEKNEVPKPHVEKIKKKIIRREIYCIYCDDIFCISNYRRHALKCLFKHNYNLDEVCINCLYPRKNHTKCIIRKKMMSKKRQSRLMKNKLIMIGIHSGKEGQQKSHDEWAKQYLDYINKNCESTRGWGWVV